MSQTKSSRFHSTKIVSSLPILVAFLLFNPLSSFLTDLLISFAILAALPLNLF